MSIEKVKIIDQITVTENGIILYREATKIIEGRCRTHQDLSQNFTHSRARPDWTTSTSGCHC
jgi:hypothetical protein